MAIQSEFSKKYIVDMEEKLPLIIDAFCQEFGEKYREVIEQRIENIRVAFAGVQYDLLSSTFANNRTITWEERDKIYDLCAEAGKKNKEYLNESAKAFLKQSLEDVPDIYFESLYDYIDAESGKTMGTCSHIPSYDYSKIYQVALYKLCKLTDDLIVHEITHAFSSTCDNPLADIYFMRSGFMSYQAGGGSHFIDLEEFVRQEKISCFNELVTEYLTKEICQNLKDKNLEIYNNRDSCRSCYRTSLVIFKPILDLIKPTLVKAYMENDLSLVQKLFSESDFKNLIDLNYDLLENVDLTFYHHNLSEQEYKDAILSMDKKPPDTDPRHFAYDAFEFTKSLALNLEIDKK